MAAPDKAYTPTLVWDDDSLVWDDRTTMWDGVLRLSAPLLVKVDRALNLGVKVDRALHLMVKSVIRIR